MKQKLLQKIQKKIIVAVGGLCYVQQHTHMILDTKNVMKSVVNRNNIELL